jgi:hypothetical protein
VKSFSCAENKPSRGGSQAFANDDYRPTNSDENTDKNKCRTKVPGQQTQAKANDYELENKQQENFITTPILIVRDFIDKTDDNCRNK